MPMLFLLRVEAQKWREIHTTLVVSMYSHSPGTRIGCTAKATPTYASQHGLVCIKNHRQIKQRLSKYQ